MEEREMIERLKNREEACFIEVVNLYKKKVISLCYAYTQDHHEAEDLSQEVFIKLYHTIHQFRQECALSTYIYKITVSKCLDYKRKKSIKNFLTGLFNVPSVTVQEDLDEKQYIRQCIINLPKDLKTVVVLYYYIGLNQKEIALILEVPTKTVEGRIYRAKQKLRTELEKEEDLLCRKNGII